MTIIIQNDLETAKLKQKLNELITIASTVETKLADRLKAIAKPLKNLKSGTMTSRKDLVVGLREIVADTEVWLCYRLALPEEQQQIKDLLLPIERYWYCELFPSWFKKKDKDFERWKQSLIQGKLLSDDADLIGKIGRTIADRKRKKKNYKYPKAEIINKLIADRAMDTDLIATANLNNPLGVQLTTQNIKHIENTKIPEWKKTLKFWEIKRGLFTSYNPQHPELINWLINEILSGADNIKEDDYPHKPLK